MRNKQDTSGDLCENPDHRGEEGGVCVSCRSITLAEGLLAVNPLGRDYIEISYEMTQNRRPMEYLVPPQTDEEYGK